MLKEVQGQREREGKGREGREGKGGAVLGWTMMSGGGINWRLERGGGGRKRRRRRGAQKITLLLHRDVPNTKSQHVTYESHLALLASTHWLMAQRNAHTHSHTHIFTEQRGKGDWQELSPSFFFSHFFRPNNTLPLLDMTTSGRVRSFSETKTPTKKPTRWVDQSNTNGQSQRHNFEKLHRHENQTLRRKE